MGDDGIGVELVGELKKLLGSSEVECIDAGTAFFAIAPDLMDAETLIIVDAVSGGGASGTMYCLGLDDLNAMTEPKKHPISLHDFGVVESLALERLRGNLPDTVVLFGIEPQRVALGVGLSAALRDKMGLYIERIMREIRACGIEMDG